jgi:lipoate-protein ligase A
LRLIDGLMPSLSAGPAVRPSAPTVIWHLLVQPNGRPGAENMALDQELLEEADRTGRAFLRLYRFEPPCLSLGRNELAADYDHAAIVRLGLDVVRRPTGGRAVWHEHEVTYAVAAPVAAFGGLREAYRAIHTRLAAALQSLGVDATLALDRPSARPPVRLSSCFATPVGGEVLVAGRKLVGSAQVRKRSAFLQHGSILLDGSQEMVRLVSRERGAGSGETTLAAALGRPVTFDEVADAIIATWSDEVTFTALHHPPPPSTALVLDSEWTWRRWATR